MSHSGADFQEIISSQLPALHLLVNLGYTYLTPTQALEARGGKRALPVLTQVLEASLKRLNRISYKGKSFDFTPENIRKGVDALANLPFESHLTTAQKAFDLLTLGTSFEQVIEGDKKSYTLRYVDWEHPENNVFHVTDEFTLERSASTQTRRPDVVVFVNGIPLAVIECKRPDLKGAVQEAISQHLRNHAPSEIPVFFCLTQLLLAVSQNAGKYGTTRTDPKFWGEWREEDPAFSGSLEALVNLPLGPEVQTQLLKAQDPWIKSKAISIWNAGPRSVTAQDKLIHSLLSPSRLLELVRGFVVFDAGTKKIARYQQYFSVRETARRVLGYASDGRRNGGVIWHTTGSGKSLTMVMLAKALTLEPSIPTPKVVLVTDRIDLDEQIRDTFKQCGSLVRQATSGKHLLKLIKENKSQVITTVIDKFEAVAQEKFRDESPDIFVLVDESHRSQYGTANALMQNVFPKACYIGFTGTPLLKKDKKTADKFGGFIHKYTMKRAVEDGAVVPLKYEGRDSALRGAQEQLDKWFDRVTRALTPLQKSDLKRKFRSAETVLEANARLQEIAFDIGRHFKSFTAMDERTGLKGQFAVSSKLDAIRYRKIFNKWGDVSVEVLISAPDTREDHDSADEADIPEVQAFWKDMMANYSSAEDYQKTLISKFKSDGEPQLLIVVDKLLTGFDAPRNAVLYLDKKLKDHSILQAIARVNRIFEGKEYGLILDYRGIFGNLTEAMDMYAALEAEGFDIEDVRDALEDVSVEIGLLPVRHTHVWDVFKGVQNQQDSDAMQEWLYPQDRRDAFYDALSSFVKTLKLALSNPKFLDETPEDVRKRYLNDLKYFLGLRKAVMFRYAESVDYSVYEKQIRQLIHEHVGADEVVTLIEPVSIFDREALDQELEPVGSPAARADAIASRIKRAISEKLEEDPVFYKRLSQLVQDAIDAYRAQRLSDLEFLKVQEDLLEKMRTRGEADQPEQLHGNADAAAYYNLNTELLGTTFKDSPDVQHALVKAALEFDAAIKRHRIRDWGTNQSVQNRMKDDMDDCLYALEKAQNLRVPHSLRDDLFEKILNVARHRDHS
jgi:type I restriction enzyme, R subunit